MSGRPQRIPIRPPTHQWRGETHHCLFCCGKVCWNHESVICRSLENKSEETSGHEEETHEALVSHRVWTLLVAQLLSVKTLGQDLVFWHTHNLRAHTKGYFNWTHNFSSSASHWGSKTAVNILCSCFQWNHPHNLLSLTSFKFLKSRSLFLSKNPDEERIKSHVSLRKTFHLLHLSKDTTDFLNSYFLVLRRFILAQLLMLKTKPSQCSVLDNC